MSAHDEREETMPTETEFESSPDAVAARARLDAVLQRLAPAELEAFWEAVKRCYASAADEE